MTRVYLFVALMQSESQPAAGSYIALGGKLAFKVDTELPGRCSKIAWIKPCPLTFLAMNVKLPSFVKSANEKASLLATGAIVEPEGHVYCPTSMGMR
jgi:hypothetical protein